VREYWVVDPEIDVIRVCRHATTTFERPIELRCDAGDIVTTALLPGLEIALVDVFAK